MKGGVCCKNLGVNGLLKRRVFSVCLKRLPYTFRFQWLYLLMNSTAELSKYSVLITKR